MNEQDRWRNGDWADCWIGYRTLWKKGRKSSANQLLKQGLQAFDQMSEEVRREWVQRLCRQLCEGSGEPIYEGFVQSGSMSKEGPTALGKRRYALYGACQSLPQGDD